MTTAQKSAVNVVFGAMTIGKKGAEQARVHTLEEASAILDIFQKHGHNEIDSARVYGEGSSETMLGDLDLRKRGIVIDTKYYPTAGKGSSSNSNWDLQMRHDAEGLRKKLMESLQALKVDKLDMWYLHGPDRTTPYDETMKAVNDLYKEGYFTRFGISNYMAWEVAQICELCDRHGWIKPSVYQGVYNAIHRTVEHELFPCLRHYGIAYFAYNPLAGGYLTDRYTRESKGGDGGDIEEGSRFDPERWQGKMYRTRYWNEPYFEALDIIRPAVKKHGLTEAECALRWMTHHSQMKRQNGDAILIGASSTKHMEQNMVDLEKGPLPDDVVQALDLAWEKVRGTAWRYFH
ncbi:Aldo/keto reductase [Viridothelium virens]|uniref:Aldo/keto reductase n=1 Tax=Viridothelium virens TaxID=1048519 RepID=A0A6A6GT35_VIRVR|nr:Aldo/keto reductase [Viridothelium virens]